jgi:hypothetical protein
MVGFCYRYAEKLFPRIVLSHILSGSGFAPTGQLKVAGVSELMNYTYSVASDNKNARTIYGFASNDSKYKRKDTGEYYPDFKKFVDYYGSTDYGDKLIRAALSGTNAGLQRGNADFTGLDFNARSSMYLFCDRGRHAVFSPVDLHPSFFFRSL